MQGLLKGRSRALVVASWPSVGLLEFLGHTERKVVWKTSQSQRSIEWSRVELSGGGAKPGGLSKDSS